MIKKGILFCSIILVHIISLAQDKTELIKLTRNEKILDFKDLGESGFILKTGKDYTFTKKLGIKLRYYDTSLNLKWEVPINRTQANRGFYNEVISSPDGKYVYNVENKGYNTTFGVNKKNITLVNAKGETKVHELEKIKDFGYFNTGFADDTYLYFLNTENGWESNDKKKVNEKLLLYCIDHESFSVKKNIVEVPAITDPEHTTFWRYAGSENEKIYLYNEVTYDKSDKFKYNFIVINSEGKRINKFGIEGDLNGKYIRPSNNYKDYIGSYQYTDDDFYTSSRTDQNGSRVSTMHPDLGAFGNFKIDFENKYVYVYGLYGSSPFKNIASVYEGYYIFKFDLNGNEIYKTIKKVPSKISEESYFKIHGTPDGRLLFLSKVENKLILSIMFKKQLHSLFFNDEDGSFKDYKYCLFDNQPGVNDFDRCEDEKLNDYVSKIDKKLLRNLNTYFISSSKSEILITENLKKMLIKLYLFNK